MPCEPLRIRLAGHRNKMGYFSSSKASNQPPESCNIDALNSPYQTAGAGRGNGKVLRLMKMLQHPKAILKTGTLRYKNKR